MTTSSMQNLNMCPDSGYNCHVATDKDPNKQVCKTVEQEPS